MLKLGNAQKFLFQIRGRFQQPKRVECYKDIQRRREEIHKFLMDISRKLKSQNVKAESMKRKTRTLCGVRYAVARKKEESYNE